MIKKLSALLLVVALAAPALAKKDSFKVMHVTDLAAALKAERKPTVCDANTKDVRKKAGVIPGAILLKSKGDLAKQLPPDKGTPLVFYCANTMCMASHYAAEKAMKAGYKDVSVMVDGIFGWKDAGQPTKPATQP